MHLVSLLSLHTLSLKEHSGATKAQKPHMCNSLGEKKNKKKHFNNFMFPTNCWHHHTVKDS